MTDASTALEEFDARATPAVDVVVPVYTEAVVLAVSVHRLHEYLTTRFPFTWRITIVDNASTDATWHLDRKGRGLALRRAWTASDAEIVAYMDADLSTDLDALLPLVVPLASGLADVAIGSRLAPGASVARGLKREVISRCYNLLLRVVFRTKVRDAQCGFKAVRGDVARVLVPAVADDGWFFDSEMLLLAEHNGLRIHEVPVAWSDDPDSRVRIVSTAIGDLKGMARVAREFARGRGRVDVDNVGREPIRGTVRP